MKDITIKTVHSELFLEKHVEYLSTYQEKFKFETEMVEYLRMSGLYWASTALNLLDSLDKAPSKESLKDFCLSCYDKKTGGFSAAPGHNAHVLYTLSAIQLSLTHDLIDYDKELLFDEIEFSEVNSFLLKLIQEDGSVTGSVKYIDLDTRFNYCVVASLKLLKCLNILSEEQKSTQVEYIKKCMNFDGGFGTVPGAESHSGQIFCCIGALKILNSIDKLVNVDTLGFWLAERQLKKSGGFNGRPEKLPDVCYSWWVLSSLKMLDRANWIDREDLIKFILASQDDELGGIADRPGDWIDPFHTLFGLAGLSMLDFDSKNKLKEINPVVCMCESTLEKYGITF